MVCGVAPSAAEVVTNDSLSVEIICEHKSAYGEMEVPPVFEAGSGKVEVDTYSGGGDLVALECIERT